jgi:hypothetical protein
MGPVAPKFEPWGYLGPLMIIITITTLAPDAHRYLHVLAMTAIISTEVPTSAWLPRPLLSPLRYTRGSRVGGQSRVSLMLVMEI